MRFLTLFAHSSSSNDIGNDVDILGVTSVLIGFLLLVVLVFASAKLFHTKKNRKFKKPLFALITLAALVPALILFGSNVYLNTVSDSKGKVYWKTGVEFWVCDQEIELVNPRGFLNSRIGNENFYEHDDKILVYDGPVINSSYDATLKRFLQLNGGDISENKLILPTEDGVFEDDTDGDKAEGSTTRVGSFVNSTDQRTIVEVTNGDSCLENGGYAEVQTFVYYLNKDTNTYSQRKLTQPHTFSMNSESSQNPGQCVIVEFGPVKDKTDKLCQSFGEADVDRCHEFGKKPGDSCCFLKEVPGTGEET